MKKYTLQQLEAWSIRELIEYILKLQTLTK